MYFTKNLHLESMNLFSQDAISDKKIWKTVFYRLWWLKLRDGNETVQRFQCLRLVLANSLSLLWLSAGVTCVGIQYILEGKSIKMVLWVFYTFVRRQAAKGTPQYTDRFPLSGVINTRQSQQTIKQWLVAYVRSARYHYTKTFHQANWQLCGEIVRKSLMT